MRLAISVLVWSALAVSPPPLAAAERLLTEEESMRLARIELDRISGGTTP